jgi:hypothetical protein
MLKKFITNPAVCAFLYVGLMVPTYILPYLGSNSYLVNMVTESYILFLVHAAIMLIMVGIVWFRGNAINKKWLVTFPVLALLFDLLPAINNIPMVPTAMHLLGLIYGLVDIKKLETVS